jgi:hypothetical protein
MAIDHLHWRCVRALALAYKMFLLIFGINFMARNRYSSSDFVTWSYPSTSPIFPAAECPDFFPLPPPCNSNGCTSPPFRPSPLPTHVHKRSNDTSGQDWCTSSPPPLSRNRNHSRVGLPPPQCPLQVHVWGLHSRPSRLLRHLGAHFLAAPSHTHGRKCSYGQTSEPYRNFS